jgi:DHA1 family bicyclomycin/chloramphenicol resistance-like MFS transporter
MVMNNSSKTKKVCWLLLVLCLCINMFSIDVFLPVMPYMVDELNTTPDTLKLIIIFNFIELSIVPLLWGSFADIKGRKPVVILSLILAIIGQFLSAICNNVYLLLTARLIQYLGAGALSCIILTLICDNFEDTRRAKAIATFELSLPIAIIFGPSLGVMLLTYLGWRGIFLLFSCIQLACLVGIVLTISETLIEKKNINFAKVFSSSLGVIRDSTIIKIILILGLAEGGWMIFTTCSPFFYIKHFSLDKLGYACYQTPIFIAFLMGLLLYRIVVNRMNVTKIFNISTFGYIVACGNILLLRSEVLVPSALNLCCTISFMNLFCGFISPSGNAIILSQIDKNFMGISTGTIVSIISLIVGCLMLCGNYIVGDKLTKFFDCLLCITFAIGILWLMFCINDTFYTRSKLYLFNLCKKLF